MLYSKTSIFAIILFSFVFRFLMGGNLRGGGGNFRNLNKFKALSSYSQGCRGTPAYSSIATHSSIIMTYYRTALPTMGAF
jgi:hypothetical protein